MFFLAGLSAMTLAPLFNSPTITVVGLMLAGAFVLLCAVARLRDMGCSGWYAPLVAIPLVAFYAGVTAGDHYQQRTTYIEYRVLATSFISMLLSLSWLASAVVR
jgi:uncharacterized membrane protein YhaH (DUF805 family)